MPPCEQWLNNETVPDISSIQSILISLYTFSSFNRMA